MNRLPEGFRQQGADNYEQQDGDEDCDTAKSSSRWSFNRLQLRDLVWPCAIVITVFFLSTAYYLAAVRHPFTLFSSGQTFLLNQRTGELWRYYRNTDDHGKFANEGFTKLR